MSVIYKTRTGGATVTVKVPYDCGNHCPFCINKREYADCSGFSIEAIKKSISEMDAITPECDFVFTGGEPLSDLKGLSEMIDCIGPKHKIYINTTIPVNRIIQGKDERDIMAFMLKYRSRVACYNVSRHLKNYVVECEDRFLRELKGEGINIRINCVLFDGKQTESDLRQCIDRWKKIGLPIQFRKDYMKTTVENLYEKDHVEEQLGHILKLDHMTGCRMRCGYFYLDSDGQTVSYHKTLPYSLIKEPSGLFIYNILYDVIINQNGSLDADWDGTPLDIEAYRKVIFEDEPCREAVSHDIAIYDGTEFFSLADKITDPKAIKAYIEDHKSDLSALPAITMKADDNHIVDEYRFGECLVYVHYAEGENVFKLCVYYRDRNPKKWAVDWLK